MKKPNVQLKKIKYHEGHEGYGVRCDVWIDGVKCLEAYDDGGGGCMDITTYVYGAKDPDKIKEHIKRLDDYIDALPKRTIGINGSNIKDDNGKDKLFKITVEDFVNDLLEAISREKENKKLEKIMTNSILFGVPEAVKYSYLKFKVPLSNVPKHILQKKVDEVKEEYCTDGKVILNTNLEALGITV